MRKEAVRAGSGSLRRSPAVILSCLLVGAVILGDPVMSAGAVSEEQPQVELTGWMPSGSIDAHPRMVIHSDLDLGFAIGRVPLPGRTEERLFIYDLRALEILDNLSVPFTALSTSLAVVDEVNDRILFPPSDKTYSSSGCETGPKPQMSIGVFNITDRSWSALTVPCTGADQFKIQGLSYHPLTNKIYALGARQGDFAARNLVIGLTNQNGQSILLRQMDATTSALDWEIDLQAAGCDSVINGSFGGLTARHGDNVFSYCYGSRSASGGFQGFAVRVPLREGKPVYKIADADNRPMPGTELMAEVRTFPTLPGPLYPFVDPVSGRMLLLTTTFTNGQAVWVLDPVRERFFGVIPSGLPPNADPSLDTFAGLNPKTGRTYLLTGAGLLVADSRHDPLPSGLSFPVLQTRNQEDGPYVAVAPSSNRLFVPVTGKGFAVLQDRVPEPLVPAPPDPDQGTSDIPEIPGETGRSFSGSASAFGIHAVNSGGVTRIVNTADPACFVVAVRQRVADDQGRCVSEQVISTGNREAFFSFSSTELGSQTGAFAKGSALTFSSKDTATDSDFRRFGGCSWEILTNRLGGYPPPTSPSVRPHVERNQQTFNDAESVFANACGATPASQFRGGTTGADGRGFPIPHAQCADFGTGANSQEQLPGEGSAISRAGQSSAGCDSVNARSDAQASSAGVALPGLADPLLTVGHSTSKVETSLTDQGIRTKATSTATGVQVGPFYIAKIESETVTLAHGRTGTNSFDFRRSISGVIGPGIDCAVCDNTEVIAAINNVLGQRMRVRVPDAKTFKSPRGYQAVVLKDTGQRDSDRALNDDDTHEVAGLEIILYNDNQFGRSRIVVQLAGVRAESRYGVFSLPDFGGGETEEDFGLSTRLVGDLDPIELPALVGASEAAGGGLIDKIIKKILSIPEIIEEGLRVIVMNFKEFGMLFATWSIFGLPVYLSLRRRLMSHLMGA